MKAKTNRNVAAVLGSVALLSSVFGCNEDAVIDEPAGAVMGMAGNGGLAGAMVAGAGGATGGAGAVTGGMGSVSGGMGGAAGTVGGMGGATGGTGGAAGTIGGIGGMGSATGGVGGAAGTIGGIGGATGGTGGAGGATGGMGGDTPPGPCPGDWICEDTSDLGATDKDGALITGTSCGGKGLVECDDANPTASCPDLPNAFCAHVFGIASCTQLCTP